MEGRKEDAEKPRWSLFPKGVLEDVLAVLEYGATKYAPNNWQKVPDARRRYYDAAMRHLEAWWQGEKNDPESGLPHLAHAICCLLFARWFEKQTRPWLKLPGKSPVKTLLEIAEDQIDQERAEKHE